MGKRERMKRSVRALVLAVIPALFLTGIFYIWIYDGLHAGFEVQEPDASVFQTVSLENDVFQEFVPDQRYLKGAEFIFINLAEDGQGEVTVRLLGADGKIKAEETKSVSDIAAGEWQYFSLVSRVKKGSPYTLQLSAQGCSIPPYVLTSDGANAPLLNGRCYTGTDAPAAGSVLAAYGFSPSASEWEKMTITLLMAVCCLVLWHLYTGAFQGQTEKTAEREKGRTAFWDSRKKETALKVGAIGLLAAQFVLSVPNVIYYLENTEFDPSWRYFLNVANGEGLKFGRDIYFTYGPLGYLCYLMKLPENTAYYWAGIAIWFFVFAMHLWLLYRLYRAYAEEKIGGMAIVLSFFVYLAGYSAPTSDNYLLYLAVLSAVLWSAGAGYVAAIPNILLALMFFGKFSTFTSGIAFFVLFGFFSVVFCKKWKSLLLFVPALVSMPVLYLLYCPSFKSLGGYVSGILKLSDGWMLTMQWDQVVDGAELRWLIAIMVCYVLLLAGALLTDYKSSSVILACSASMFFVYKYATTRHGLKVGLWLFAMLFSAVVLSVNWEELRKKCRSGKFAFAAVGTVMAGAVFCTGALSAHALQNNTGKVKEALLTKAERYTHLNTDSVSPEFIAQNQLPEEIVSLVGDRTITVYPWRNGYGAVYPEWNMVWYPSVQNGNEYIPWMDSKVADWFESEKAAECILLTNDNIDSHIRYLDNPLTWDAIRRNYEVERIAGEFALLKRVPVKEEPELVLLETKEYPIGEKIECLPEADYVKIKPELTVEGKLKKFLYHVGVVNMDAFCEDGSTLSGRLVVPNLPSGFWLEKTPETLEELEAVLNRQEAARIEAFCLNGMGLSDYEQNLVVEWYRAE